MDIENAQKEIEHFNRWSRTYEDSWIQRFVEPVHKDMLSVITKQLSVPRSVLDVGCGTGRLLRKAAALWPSAQLIGVDPATGMVDIARQRTQGATIHLAGAESLPLADSPVDVALSSISFHHWRDQAAGVREIARVLCSGGCFCLTDLTIPDWLARIQRHAKGPRQTRNIVEASGLTVEVQRRTYRRLVLLTLGAKPPSRV